MALWLLLSVVLFGGVHLYRTSAGALSGSHAARARGEFLQAVLLAEQAAECVPFPAAAEGRALLVRYAGEAEANKDRSGAALAWQAYERALASTGRLTPEATVEIRAGLSRASVAEGAAADSVHVPRLPEVATRRDAPWFALAAVAVIVFGGLYLRRPTKLGLACVAGVALVFAGLGFLV
jgi:hypothetical protein